VQQGPGSEEDKSLLQAIKAARDAVNAKPDTPRVANLFVGKV
jgi:hypothetical protein